MKATNLSTEELKKLLLPKTKDEQESLKKSILDLTEAKVKNPFSDKNLDENNERRNIISSLENLWRIKDLDSQILKFPSDYEKIFVQEYYQEIYRLNGWKYQGTIAQKPWSVGRYTNQIIYYRFSHEVLPIIRMFNPYVTPGFRRYKHHQYLTPGSRLKLEQFISQAVESMRECSDWDEFRIKYCTRYNVPYQLTFKF